MIIKLGFSTGDMCDIHEKPVFSVFRHKNLHIY